MRKHGSEKYGLVSSNSYKGSGKEKEPLPEVVVVVEEDYSWRKWLVGLVAFLYMASFAMSFFTFTQYVYIKLQRINFKNKTIDTAISYCDTNETDPDYQTQISVQKQASEWSIYFYLAGGVPSIFANFVLGSYTDRFGRKFLFFLSCTGSLIRTVINAVGIHYDIDLIYFVVAFVIEGFTGQMFGLLQVSFIYAADVTKQGKQRSLGIVLVEMATGLGFSLLSFATGYFMEEEGFLYPMITSSAIMAAAIFFIFFLPETHPETRRRKHSSKLENLRDAYGLYFSTENAGKRWMYWILLLVFTFTITDVLGRVGVEGLYQLNAPFCWSPKDLGWFGTMRSGFQHVFGMLLVKVLHVCFSDESVAMIGCISFAAGFLLEAFAETDVELYLVTVVSTCGLLTIPMVRAIMSRMTSPDRQGAVFATISSMETLINLVSSTVSNAIYAATVDFFRGFIFLLFAGFNVISLLLIIIFVIGSRRGTLLYSAIPGR